jgi:Mg2+ and Co2+ transporter CorA
VVEFDAASHYRSLERRFERAVDAADHARELINASFQLFATRTAQSTNELVRRLTFITMLLGAVGAIAGIFGMNFETPLLETGTLGFWSVIALLAALIAGSVLIARRKKWL